MLLGEGDGWGLDSPTTSLPNFFIFTFLSLSGEGDGCGFDSPIGFMPCEPFSMAFALFGDGDGCGLDSLTRLPSFLPAIFESLASAETQSAIKVKIITTKNTVLFILLFLHL